jgi:glutathione synthase/RimK-type ligase-like ATP-grasp enzyme
MLHSFAVRSGGEEEVVFTTEMTAEHLADLEGLDLCPMTFQEKVRKAVELRVTVVGRQAFAAEIASPEVVGAEIDWRRRGEEAKERWKVHALPALVEERIHGFMDRLGLNYGALDFILTPDGRYVFLEVNPSGEFSWLLVWPGLPIAEALADTLLGRVERR